MPIIFKANSNELVKVLGPVNNRNQDVVITTIENKPVLSPYLFTT